MTVTSLIGRQLVDSLPRMLVWSEPSNTIVVQWDNHAAGRVIALINSLILF
jgi:hypothetical protein